MHRLTAKRLRLGCDNGSTQSQCESFPISILSYKFVDVVMMMFKPEELLGFIRVFSV
jgi:hypothetical protein